MPEIRLEHITKRWGKFYGVDDLNLVIENNAFVTLLGPSGCCRKGQKIRRKPQRQWYEAALH